jgi:hypothetical protein
MTRFLFSKFHLLRPLREGLSFALVKMRIKKCMFLVFMLAGVYLKLDQWARQKQQSYEQGIRVQQTLHLFQQHQATYRHFAQNHPEYHFSFEQSLLFQKTDQKKLERIFHYLLNANQVVLERLQIKEEAGVSSLFVLYTIDLSLKSFSDRELMAFIRSLDLPNVLMVKKICLERAEKLREKDVQRLVKQQEEIDIFLVKAEITLTWISWLDA